MALPPFIQPQKYATSIISDHPISQPSVSKPEADTFSKFTTATPNRSSPLAPNISIQKLDSTTLPCFRRIISLLLPIRYPDKFFSEILSDASVSSLSRVSVWHDRAPPGKRKCNTDKEDAANIETPDGKVVGGIRCRLEPIPVPPGQTPPKQQQLYIQTLVLLSPYRGHGIATHLLDTVVTEAIGNQNNVTSVYAHVWEANLEGLDWYRRRGFHVEEKVLEGYYRKLKPGGAIVVRKGVGIGDHLRAQRLEMGQEPKETLALQAGEKDGYRVFNENTASKK